MCVSKVANSLKLCGLKKQLQGSKKQQNQKKFF